ncbi:NADH dehydrogenase subunit N [Stackebrandtia albiflava]|uniref:NADH-quinone oxidoreductase subunit N n=1 Tax=Stackebrandtia albiflava TaxID=406432 RepID=A0A562UXV3_9ACTN|nr:proton-conducting transporter membrane subunit [Stackebrandtia albiflava]TWJ10436.1 NADH dehydrogenase subunit N [Stackebrandtia albiflava]
MSQTIDHVALLPAYLAAATALAVLLTDLFSRHPVPRIAVAGIGFAATAAAAVWLGTLPPRQTFCTDTGCSLVTGGPGAAIAATTALLGLAVLALSARPLLAGDAPPGEYAFLLACSVTGGVMLAYGRDLITLIVALETLTLPLYVLVAMRGGSRRGAVAAVNFLLVSVTAGAITLLGAALLYAVTGTLHLTGIAAALRGDTIPLTAVAVAVIITGVGFKLAAVPLHGWAPGSYDGAPLPIAAYLSTASKLGGVAVLLWLVTEAFPPVLHIAGPVLTVLAVATMSVGNLLALRQRRTVRLLAASSIAQAGYLLVPLAGLTALAGPPGTAATAATAVLVFALFYVMMEVAAFTGVIALRWPRADGGELGDLAGSLRAAPGPAVVLLLALAALAGLPPALAGLFAKITVVSSVAMAMPWLAVVVAVNAVVGLAYYLRFGVLLVRGRGTEPAPAGWPVTAVLALSVAALVIVGFAPQLLWRLASFG